MKKLLFIALLICSSMYSSAQNEISKLKQTVNAEKRNVQHLVNKRDNLITSYQIAARDYRIANAKKDSLSQKPNSPAYKNAVKKADKLLNERNQLFASIEQLKHEIDSINLVIANQESKLQQLESQKAEGKKDKNSKKSELKHNKSEKPAEKPSDKKTKKKEQDTEGDAGRTLVKHDEEIFQDNVKTDVIEESTEIEVVTEESNSSNDKSSTSPFSNFLSKVWKFIKICFWVICGIVFLIIAGKMTGPGSSAGHRSSGSSSGGSSSSRSSSSRSSSPSNEHTKQMIRSYQADLERAKARLDNAKLQYKKSPTNTNRSLVEQYTKEVGRIKSIIATKKSHLK